MTKVGKIFLPFRKALKKINSSWILEDYIIYLRQKRETKLVCEFFLVPRFITKVNNQTVYELIVIKNKSQFYTIRVLQSHYDSLDWLEKLAIKVDLVIIDRRALKAYLSATECFFKPKEVFQIGHWQFDMSKNDYKLKVKAAPRDKFFEIKSTSLTHFEYLESSDLNVTIPIFSYMLMAQFNSVLFETRQHPQKFLNVVLSENSDFDSIIHSLAASVNIDDISIDEPKRILTYYEYFFGIDRRKIDYAAIVDGIRKGLECVQAYESALDKKNKDEILSTYFTPIVISKKSCTDERFVNLNVSDFETQNKKYIEPIESEYDLSLLTNIFIRSMCKQSNRHIRDLNSDFYCAFVMVDEFLSIYFDKKPKNKKSAAFCAYLHYFFNCYIDFLCFRGTIDIEEKSNWKAKSRLAFENMLTDKVKLMPSPTEKDMPEILKSIWKLNKEKQFQPKPSSLVEVDNLIGFTHENKKKKPIICLVMKNLCSHLSFDASENDILEELFERASSEDESDVFHKNDINRVKVNFKSGESDRFYGLNVEKLQQMFGE